MPRLVIDQTPLVFDHAMQMLREDLVAKAATRNVQLTGDYMIRTVTTRDTVEVIVERECGPIPREVMAAG